MQVPLGTIKTARAGQAANRDRDRAANAAVALRGPRQVALRKMRGLAAVADRVAAAPASPSTRPLGCRTVHVGWRPRRAVGAARILAGPTRR